MKRASRFFNDEQRARIERAVVEAESKTSAEIVPVVATSSGRYDRAEDVVGLWLGLVLMALVWVLWPQPDRMTATWGLDWTRLGLPAFVAAGLIGFVGGALVAGRMPWLRRLFTPRVQMRDEVNARARSVFFDDRVHRTQGATGILVYLSLYERTAVILADETAHRALGDGALNELCDRLTRGLSGGDPADAVCATIADLGERLAAPLPRAADDRDELPDALVVLDNVV